MLRITEPTRSNGRRVIRLEGRLVGPWVAEVRQIVAGLDAATLRLDLAGLAFADAAGVGLLRTLRDGGAELGDPSGFLAALIGVDDGEDGSEDRDVG